MRLFSFGKLFCDLFQLLFFFEVVREAGKGKMHGLLGMKHGTVLFTKNKELS